MLDSFGLGEWGIVAIVAVLFLDPKKLGVAGRAFARFRKKWNDIQREVKQQFNVLALEEDLKNNLTDIRSVKTALRAEARDVLKTIPSVERAAAAEKILERLKTWPGFLEAKVVAAFAGTHEEVDTEGILRQALAMGKTVLLPRIHSMPDGSSRMTMIPIRNYDTDLTEGAFGILEPILSDSVRVPLVGAPAESEPDLILIPGLAFDDRGGRVGKGKGFYDRYLDGKAGLKIGLAFQAQLFAKKLALEPHDKLMDGLVTEERILTFSKPVTPEQNPAG